MCVAVANAFSFLQPREAHLKAIRADAPNAVWALTSNKDLRSIVPRHLPLQGRRSAHGQPLTLLKSQPQIWAIGADGKHSAPKLTALKFSLSIVFSLEVLKPKLALSFG